MKKSRYIIVALAVLLISAMLFAACSKGNKFEMSGGKYVDKTSGITYYAAPACYEPIEISDELYGTLEKVELYRMGDADPEKWLCEKNGSVFYSSETELPALGGLDISYAEIVLEDTVLVKITDTSVIDAVVKAYADGEDVGRPYVATAEDYEINWRIRFADETRGIYYILSYVEIGESYVVEDENGAETDLGKKFIFNRFEDNRCVVAGDALDKYVAEFKELATD
jgi:hypothetical protein